MKTWLLCFSFIVASQSVNDKITITTTLGDIIGNVKLHNVQDKVYEFLGIQYGIPPENQLRFRPAQLNTSSWNTTYNATTYGPKCIQPYAKDNEMSENCLFLNIWTCQIDKNNLLPVMLWIHGGSMITGSGSDPSYNGQNIVENGKNFILVTINYRLGPLGLLASKQLYEEDDNWQSYGGMNSVYDQIQAVKWTKQYISSFGGDPNKITIFGESAGGESVCYILISPIVPNNLFQRAIVESGACIGPWGGIDTDTGLLTSSELLISNGMSTDLDTLRQYPASKFKFNVWSTSVDTLVLKELPSVAYANLNSTVFNGNELIMGYNSMDGIVEGSIPKTPVEYTEHLETFIRNKTQVNLIETVYYPLSDFPAAHGNTNASLAWQSINGDLCVACPTIRIMKQVTQQKVNNFKGYLYEFRGPPPHYAPHGSEISFVYDHPDNEGIVKWDQALSDAMVSAWTNYGKYGLPNVTLTNKSIEWKEFRATEENVMIWDDNPRVETNYVFRHNACDFWYNEVGYEIMANICCYACLYE